MSGLIAIVQRTPSGDLQDVFGRIRRAVPTRSRGTLVSRSDPQMHWCVGQMSTRAIGDLPKDGDAEIPVFIDGRLNQAGDKHNAGYADQQTIVREAYRSHGTRLGEMLDGDFCAVVVDARAQRLVLVNSVSGSYPLYWNLTSGRLVIAPSVSAVCRALGTSPTPNLRASADYVHYGFIFGNKTLAEGVDLVPAGATLVHNWNTGGLEIKQHHRPAALFAQSAQSQADYLGHVHHEFNRAVRSACTDADSLGLSLSGGLDSRAILSAIDTSETPLRTYTVGVRRCADDVIGARLARIADTTHTFFELGQQYLKEFLQNVERMVSITDGLYLSHGLTEILALQAVEQAGIKTLLRGHCGELAKMRLAWPFQTDAQVYAMDRGEFVPYFFRRVNYVSAGIDPVELFQDGAGPEVRRAALESLEQAIDSEALSPAELCGFVYFTEHHRRFTIPSLELFRTYVDVRLPFADPGFLRALLSGRPEWRDGVTIHQYMTGANAPRLAAVRNSNTGAPGNAGPLLEKLLDPLNSVLKRLNAPGFRHYHHFDAWMRRELLASVSQVLLDGMTERRGIVRTATVRRLLEETRTGSADHAYLLQVLLIIELWHRQNAPGAASNAA